MRLSFPAGRRAVVGVLVLALVLAAGAWLLLFAHKGPATPAIQAATPGKAASPAGLTRPVSAAQAGLRTLQGVAFITSYLSTWSEWHNEAACFICAPGTGNGGAHTYQLSSTHGQPSKRGIPPAGAIGITISEQPATPTAKERFGRARRAAVGRAVVSFLRDFVRPPRGAQGVTLASPPQHSNLAGAEAGIESYGYTYRGVKNIQVDIVADQGGNFVLIELDTEPKLAARGAAALETLGKSWRWL
jgi:hypothetical protein